VDVPPARNILRQRLPWDSVWSNKWISFAPFGSIFRFLPSFPRNGYPMQDVAEDISEVSFQDLDLPQWLTDRLAEVGYESPTPVQAAAIPAVRSGVDVVAQAQTGTGK